MLVTRLPTCFVRLTDFSVLRLPISSYAADPLPCMKMERIARLIIFTTNKKDEDRVGGHCVCVPVGGCQWRSSHAAAAHNLLRQHGLAACEPLISGSEEKALATKRERGRREICERETHHYALYISL